MKREELLYKNEIYDRFKEDWELYNLIRKSGKPLVEYALKRQARESLENWEARVRDGVVFNVGKTVVEIFNFYLNQKETTINIEGLADDPQWKMFLSDSDLMGTDYQELMVEARKWASYFGSIGILVNKPTTPGRGVKAELRNRIYPYCTLYSLQNIHDWVWRKDPVTHRKILAYLKLYEGDNTWTLWFPEKWEQWQITNDVKKTIIKVDQGVNLLGEIPFLWMINLRDFEFPEIGQSDVVDIGPIVCSIAQNLSCADEVIKYAGYPIMRVPMEREDLAMAKVVDDEDADGIPVGATAVSEFDPSLGEGGKADWMPTEILEPIDAVLKVINEKRDEAYRISYLSGIHAQRRSANTETSGLALRYELSQLNSVLISKSDSSIEAQRRVIELWLKWQNKSDLFDGTEIKQSHEFSIDELAVTLENAITAYGAVLSKTFRERVQRKIAFSVMPDISQADKDQIVIEIANNTPDKAEFGTQITNRALVKSAANARADHSKDQDRPDAESD